MPNDKDKLYLVRIAATTTKICTNGRSTLNY